MNQVFQFAQSGTCAQWADGSTTKASAYLWIPERCRRVRGLLVLCANVPEHRLAGSPAIRDVCAARDLGIVWCTPSFMSFKGNAKNETATIVGFLQRLLDGLAAQSGYDEVATAPLLPIGESGHLLMVDALVEQCPERCIAGVWLKNPHLPPKNRTVPALVLFGSAQEWGQTGADYLGRWQDAGHYDVVCRERRDHPDWPLTYLIDPGSGHFDMADGLSSYLARYIDRVCEARLAAGGAPTLKPVGMNTGYVADLPVPGHPLLPPVRYEAANAEARGHPWFFDAESAAAAQGYANVDWHAASQLPAVLGGDGKPLPFDFNGIENLKHVDLDEDGRTFTLRSAMLDKLPAEFKQAGAPLSVGDGQLTVEWLCGPLEPLGAGRFRIALDRSWPNAACYLASRHPGGPGVRPVVQPCGVDIKAMAHREGARQTITFEQPPGLAVGAPPLPLTAASDAGLPVSFYVESGPAVIRDGTLVLTPIPPRTKFPIAVTVAAWQWGRGGDHPVKIAEIVRRTIAVTPPSPTSSPATRPE